MLSELYEPLACSGSNRHTSSPASPPDKKENREHEKGMELKTERCGALFFKPSNVLCLHALPNKPETQRIWIMTQFNCNIVQKLIKEKLYFCT